MKREYHGFSDWADVARQFQEDIGPEPSRVWAAYAQPPYEGEAVVVYLRDRKWWLAGGSHCSCYGLEGQWSPEPFKPSDHLGALERGKRIVNGVRGDADLPEADDAHLDDWLRQNAR